jgi:hypothetical protein
VTKSPSQQCSYKLQPKTEYGDLRRLTSVVCCLLWSQLSGPTHLPSRHALDSIPHSLARLLLGQDIVDLRFGEEGELGTRVVVVIPVCQPTARMECAHTLAANAIAARMEAPCPVRSRIQS